MAETSYQVGGMDCADCARTVEKGVRRLEGVQGVEVDFTTGKLRISGEVNAETLRERLETLGYSLMDEQQAAEEASRPGGVWGFALYLLRSHETRFALTGAAVMIVTALLSLLTLPPVLINGLYTLAMAIAVYPIARSGINTLLINRDFNINLLMTIAAVGAGHAGAAMMHVLTHATFKALLFVAAGAFHVAKPSEMIPELQGRFPIRVELNNLDEEDFYKILTQPKNALLKQYQALLTAEGVEISFTDEAVRAIARTAAEVNSDVENIGARRLHTILTTLLEDILFEVPDEVHEDAIEVDAAMVEERLASIATNRDLSQYIL